MVFVSKGVKRSFQQVFHDSLALFTPTQVKKGKTFHADRITKCSRDVFMLIKERCMICARSNIRNTATVVTGTVMSPTLVD